LHAHRPSYTIIQMQDFALIDSFRERLSNLSCDGSAIDKDAIRAASQEQRFACRIPGGRRNDRPVWCLAIAAAAKPTEVVAPRINGCSDFPTLSDRQSEPQAGWSLSSRIVSLTCKISDRLRPIAFTRMSACPS